METSHDCPGGSDDKASAYNMGDPGSILGQEYLLEKEMVTHSSTLAWKIPRTEEPTVHGVAKSQTQLSNFSFFLSFFRRLLRSLSVTFFKLKMTTCKKNILAYLGNIAASVLDH